MLKSVYPIGAGVVDDVNYRAYRPCDRVCPVNELDLADKGHYDGDIGNSDSTPYREHYKHGNKRLACASADRRDGV